MEAPVSSCAVFVPGGSPAGSTIAALLAERGWDGVIAKESPSRFHIGESLLPLNLPLLDRLGVREQVERIGLIKYGAEFTSLRSFKCVYYLNNLAHTRRILGAGRKRTLRNRRDESPAHA